MWTYCKRSGLCFVSESHENDFAKLISVLDLSMLRDVGTMINEIVRHNGRRCNLFTDKNRLIGRNLLPPVAFASSSI